MYAPGSPLTPNPSPRLGSAAQALFVVLLCAVPAALLNSNIERRYGFTQLIHFGDELLPHGLEEAQKAAPATDDGLGYDGQFYAQIALDPTLRHPQLPVAIDNVVYRAGRIGLPVMAFLLGMGLPERVLQAYGALNFLFWLILLGLLYRCVGFHTLKSRVLCATLLWSTGTLVSMQRALIDLPAVVVTLGALFLTMGETTRTRRFLGNVLWSLSVLVKETSLLSLPALEWPRNLRALLKLGLRIALILVPYACWRLYIRAQLPPMNGPPHVLAWPLWDYCYKLVREVMLQSACWNLELWAPLSLLVQFTYFFARAQPSSAYWRMGIGFALLATVAGVPIWSDQFAYTRVFLPLTFAFNLQLHAREEGRKYFAWLLLGNLGVLGGINLFACGIQIFDKLVLAWVAFEVWHLTKSNTVVTARD